MTPLGEATPQSPAPALPPQMLDKRDRYGRLLRYVFKERTHVNLELWCGAASPWFYEGEPPKRYAATVREGSMAVQFAHKHLAAPNARIG